MEAYTITPCPSCSVKIKHRPNRLPRACPRCQSSLAGIAGALVAGAGTTSASAPARGAARPDGFGACLAAGYKASRFHWIVPVLIGLLAAGALSLLKPLLGGVRGLAIATAAIACAGAGCGALYFAQQVIRYLFLGKRSAAASPPSWLARIAHLCITMLVPVVPLVGAECVGPPQGWLAKVLPLAGAIAPVETPGDSPAQPATTDSLADPKNPFKVIEE